MKEFKIRYSTVLVLLLFLGLISCRKNPSKGGNNALLTPQESVFDYMTTRSNVSFSDGGTNFSSPIIIKIRKDSAIWLSAAPFIGIEALRGLIRKDSAFFLDRLHKDCYIYSYASLKKKFGIELNYNILESVFTGNLIEGSALIKSYESDSITILSQKISGFMVKNFLNKNNQKLEKIEIQDQMIAENTLNLMYSDFKVADRRLVAHKNDVKLQYISKEGKYNSSVVINHSKISFPDQLAISFSIPSSYKRIYE